MSKLLDSSDLSILPFNFISLCYGMSRKAETLARDDADELTTTYMLCMSSKTVNITLPEELLKKIDRAMSGDYRIIFKVELGAKPEIISITDR